MIRQFRIWLASQLIRMPTVERQGLQEARLAYVKAQKAHRGQRAAYARMQAALHASLERELLR